MEKRKIGTLCSSIKKTINPQDKLEQYYWHYSIPAFDKNETPEFTSGSQIRSNKLEIKKNCILFSRLNPRIKRIWDLYRCPIKISSIASTEFVPFVIDRSELLSSRYLYWYLSSDNFLNTARSGVEAATKSRERVNKERLFNIPIPLPPLSHQEKIAAVLDRADGLRRKRKAAIEKLDRLIQSVFQEMFGDPVTNPKGWYLEKLCDVGVLQRGRSKHRPRNASELLGGKHPLIQTGDVANSGYYINEFNQTYSDIGLAQSKMWPAGTMCITIAANIAKAGILNFDACFPDSVVGFTSNGKVKTPYVYYWLSFLQKIIEDKAPESAQKNINLKILSELDIPTPPLKLQDSFGMTLDKVEKQRYLMQASLQKLDENFNSLLQRAFKGELDFNDTAFSAMETDERIHAQ